MAEVKKSGSKKNGPALGKRAKIDSAQRNMLVAVGIASVVFGITLVMVVYFAKTISFNAKLIGVKDEVIASYKQAQNSLESISNEINDLAYNEFFESVARQRSEKCRNSNKLGEIEEYSLEELDKASECSALRVITDALPTQQNIETALTSFIILLELPENGTVVTNASAGDISSASIGEDGTTLNTIGVTLTFEDGDASRIMNSLSSIENSIRNYDIRLANFNFGDGLEINAEYSAYYTDSATLHNIRRIVCADAENENCIKAGGDNTKIEVIVTPDY